MSLEIKQKMKDVSRKSTEEVTQQEEELINTSKLENRFNDNISSLRRYYLQKQPPEVFCKKRCF